MTQKKVVKNKAGVNKELKLSNGWDITKTDYGYMLDTPTTMIHGNKLKTSSENQKHVWLNVYQNNIYIGSVWIDNSIDIKNIKEFIKGD